MGYATYEQAQAYVDKYYGEDSPFYDCDESEITVFLNNSTLMIDARFGGCYLGDLLEDDQEYLFPRTEFTDNNGRLVSEGTFPRCLINATVEGALYLIDGSDISGTENQSNVQSESVSVGSVSTSTSYTGTGAFQDESGKISLMLDPILDGSGVDGFSFSSVERG